MPVTSGRIHKKHILKPKNCHFVYEITGPTPRLVDSIEKTLKNSKMFACIGTVELDSAEDHSAGIWFRNVLFQNQKEKDLCL
jgi:hypothetical protein